MRHGLRGEYRATSRGAPMDDCGTTVTQRRAVTHMPAGDDDRQRGSADGVEPDYRFTLANERTFLAWQRTALGLLAAAVAAVQLVPELGIPGARHVLGVALAVLATATAGVGLRRWKVVDYAIRRGMPLPRHPTPTYLAVGLIILGLATLALVIGKAVTG